MLLLPALEHFLSLVIAKLGDSYGYIVSKCFNSVVQSTAQQKSDRTVASTMLFQPRSVVEDSINDDRYYRTQPFAFWHRGHLGKQLSSCGITCMFHFHVYTHVTGGFSCYMYLAVKFHVTYSKFMTRINNKPASQRGCAIASGHCMTLLTNSITL